jgi:undecaprenyl-diphosphatase
MHPISYFQGIVLGLLQGFSELFPISNRDAARFSFMLATPIIGAAAVLKVPTLLGHDGDGVRGPAFVAALCAAVTAYLAVRFLMRFFETNRLTPFAVYCAVAGAVLTLGFVL